MPETMILEVITPERKVLETEVESVEIPGLDGELGILPGHTELVSQLRPAGLLTYHKGGEKHELAISEGFLEVTPNRVVVLANRAEKPEDIDLARALRSKEQAELRLKHAMSNPEIDIHSATTEYETASIELQMAEKARK